MRYVADRPGAAPAASDQGDGAYGAVTRAGPPPSVRSSVRAKPRPAVPTPRGPRGLLGDVRGLTAAGGALVVLLAGLAGGAVDVLTGSGLRTVFAVAFGLGCVCAAAKVHHEDLVAAVVAPPLVYAVVAVVGGLVEASGAGGSLVRQQALELFTSLVLGAPALLTSTGLALLVVLMRAARFRSRRARRTGRSRH